MWCCPPHIQSSQGINLDGAYLRHGPTVVRDDERLTVLHRTQHRRAVAAQLMLADVGRNSGHADKVTPESIDTDPLTVDRSLYDAAVNVTATVVSGLLDRFSLCVRRSAEPNLTEVFTVTLYCPSMSRRCR